MRCAAAVPAHVRHLAGAGADAVLVTCSSIGEAAEQRAASRSTSRWCGSTRRWPSEAVALADAPGATGRVAVLATLASTLGPTGRLVERAARAAGRRRRRSRARRRGAAGPPGPRGTRTRHDALVAGAVARARRGTRTSWCWPRRRWPRAAGRAAIDVPVLSLAGRRRAAALLAVLEEDGPGLMPGRCPGVHLLAYADRLAGDLAGRAPAARARPADGVLRRAPAAVLRAVRRRRRRLRPGRPRHGRPAARHVGGRARASPTPGSRSRPTSSSTTSRRARAEFRDWLARGADSPGTACSSRSTRSSPGAGPRRRSPRSTGRARACRSRRTSSRTARAGWSGRRSCPARSTSTCDHPAARQLPAPHAAARSPVGRRAHRPAGRRRLRRQDARHRLLHDRARRSPFVREVTDGSRTSTACACWSRCTRTTPSSRRSRRSSTASTTSRCRRCCCTRSAPVTSTGWRAGSRSARRTRSRCSTRTTASV